MNLLRAVHVQQFAAERIKEIGRVAKLVQQNENMSFGAPALKRNKRRRTNAHIPRKRYKRPRNMKTSTPLGKVNETQELQHSVECEAKPEEDANARTGVISSSVSAAKCQQGSNRRMRRDRPGLTFCKIETPDEGPLRSQRSTHLPTHKYFVKRYKMRERFGWTLPLHAHGKGHQGKCLKHAMRERAVLHDITFWPTLKVNGPISGLIRALRSFVVCRPFKEPLESQHRNRSQSHENTREHLDSDNAIAQLLTSWREADSLSSWQVQAWVRKPDAQSSAISPCFIEHIECSQMDPSSDLGSVALNPSRSVQQLRKLGSTMRSELNAGGTHVSMLVTVHPAAKEWVLSLLQSEDIGEVTVVQQSLEARWILTGRGIPGVLERAFATSLPARTEKECGESCKKNSCDMVKNYGRVVGSIATDMSQDRPGPTAAVFHKALTGDEQVVAQFAINAIAASTDVGDRILTQAWDQKARLHARTLCRLWAAKGYQVVYLSGRQGSFYNLTLQWLAKHHFPPGPIHLTRSHVPTMPLYVSVGNFKLQYMQGLVRKGFELYAAYGNTGTDVRAYEAAGIPKERTFTIGQAAGSGGTQHVRNWTLHLKDVLALPDSDVPIPYVDLLYCGVPKYKGQTKRAKLKNATFGFIQPGASEKKTAEEFSNSTHSSDVEGLDVLEYDAPDDVSSDEGYFDRDDEEECFQGSSPLTYQAVQQLSGIDEGEKPVVHVAKVDAGAATG